MGITRFLRYGGVFLALALPLLLMVPWTFATVLAILLLSLTAFAFGPLPLLSVLFLLISACALGSLLINRGPAGSARDESGQGDLLATLAGLAVYILLMYAVAREPVNYPAAWAALLALPVLVDWRGVAGRLLRWWRALPAIELRSPAARAPFALLAFVLGAHWLVVLKPEVSADGLSQHMAIAADIATHHMLTLQPVRFTWSVMPMGADFSYSVAYLMGGEFAARLLDFAFLLALVALLYFAARRYAGPAIGFLLAALFATTPMVQLVTGSLFVENVQAALLFGMMAALWRFDDTAQRRYLNIAMLLGGVAVSVKLGSLMFVLLALPFAAAILSRHRKALGPKAPRPAAAAILAIVLLIAAAAPPYAIAYAKTGNPLFPFLNPSIHSPLLDPKAIIQDYRFVQKLSWRTLYDLTFRSTLFYEGQGGSFGFQYLLLAPLALLGLAVVRRGPARSAAAIAWGASIIVLLSTPNARYVYPALPLLMVACAAVLVWMLNHQPWVARLLLAATAACLAMNLYFLPSASYYHKDFCLRSPFSALERHRYIHEAAPVREVIAHFNTAYPDAPVLLGDDSSFAGLTGDVYENHWHQYNTFDSLSRAATTADAVHLLQSWKVEHLILHKSSAGEERRPPVMNKLVADCTALEYESGDVYLARLEPSCPGRPTVAASFVAPPGFYDDSDPAIRFEGDWSHDTSFKEPQMRTISYTDVPGAEFSFAFDGPAIDYTFTKAPNRGIAAVSVDGASQGTIDLYSSRVEWQTRQRFCCFAAGRHVFTVRVTGERYPQSSGRFVDLDSLVVE